MATPFYHRSIRKIIVGFGNLFSKITLVRYNPDMSEQERFIVPIAYASKERYVMRLEGDPDADKKVQLTLPRMSFEMNGVSYDASRKQNTNVRNYASGSSGAVSAQYNPVPYNFDFSLYVYVRSIEDGTQIIEHILPYFTPDYTIKINMIPEMGIIKEIPIVLNSTKYDVEYEGSRENDSRMIIWTLNFTAKGHVFGGISSPKLIHTTITNIIDNLTPNDIITFNLGSGNGMYQDGEMVYQGFSSGTATATARVVSFDVPNKKLTLTNISGNFVSNQYIVGLTTNASYLFTSYENITTQIVVTPSPTDANVNSLYTYTTTIIDYPDGTENVIVSTDFSGDLGSLLGTDDLLLQQDITTDLM
jgi:hypothetical protein